MGGSKKTIKSWLYPVERRILMTVCAFLSAAVAIVLVYVILGPRNGDLRDSIPVDAVAFVRIKDPSQMLRLVSREIGDVEKNGFRFLEGVDIAFAITGFEASEESLTEQDSVLNVRPKFAAVVETNAWSWQVRGFVDGPLNQFIKKKYGKDAKMENRPGKFGSMTVWTAADGRKTFAVVRGSRVFFGNELNALDSCLSVSEGQNRSLLEDPDLEDLVSRNADAAILGYFPRRAVEAFADVAGVSAAVSGSEEVGMRAFIARLVPQLMRRGLERVHWTSRVEDGRFVDTLELKTTDSISGVFSETMKPQSGNFERLADMLPQGTVSVTRYQLRNPRIAYRSLVLFAAGSSDPVSAQLISGFSDSMLQPYGVADAELFLDSVGPELLTVQTGGKDEGSVAIVMVKNREAVLKALTETFEEGTPLASRPGWNILYSGDDVSAAAFNTDILVIGDREIVLESIGGNGKKAQITAGPLFDAFRQSKGTAVTIAAETTHRPGLAATGGGDNKMRAYFLSETSFSASTVTRVYYSSAGLIGELLDSNGE
ncbi:MAG: hypothetical protein OEM82_01930 [Acidobacteriota bacterium]|nr:hypothetical protein [Acidobacteriota bacterium]MDH3530179.1 hypothetical protein [Acidobacteriota bacterium]